MNFHKSFSAHVGLLAMTGLFTMGLVAGPAAQFASLAQSKPAHHVHKKKLNIAEKHPTATGAAAGFAAYKLSKKTGKNRQMAGKKRNFAQRHPVLTGVAAGVVTHKVMKNRAAKKKQHNQHGH